MKKWQLIVCSLGICFIPTLLCAVGYTYAFITLDLHFNAIPYFPMLLGLFLSYLIYSDNKEFVK
jgi:hypothetical protein